MTLFRPRNEVLRATKEVSDRGLQGLLVNLRAQDRDRDGVLSTDMVKGSLKKFQVTTKIGKKNVYMFLSIRNSVNFKTPMSQ